MSGILLNDIVIDILSEDSSLVTYTGFNNTKAVENILSTMSPFTSTSDYVFTLISSNGHHYSNGSDMNKNLSFSDFNEEYVFGHNTQILYYSHYPYSYNNQSYISTYVPIKNDDKTIGVMIVDISEQKIEKIFSSVTQMDYLLLVLNENDDLLYSNFLHDEMGYDYINSNLDLKSGNIVFEEKNYFYLSNSSQTNRYKTIILLPEDNIFEDSTALLLQFILVLSLLFLEGLVLSRFISKRVTRRIIDLNSDLIEFTKNKKPILKKVEDTDEIGQLESGVCKMSNEIVQQIELIKSAEKQKRQLHFRTLQAQMNPHLIYNTLNTITELAQMQNVMNISDVTSSFSQMLKLVLSNPQDEISILEEISYVENYVNIKKYNIINDIEVRVKIDDASLYNEKILKFLIQPFVENSIKHGFKTLLNKNIISIKISRNLEDIVIEIVDNGIGMDKEIANSYECLLPQASINNNIGIRNTLERLYIRYEDKYKFSISSKPFCYTKIYISYPSRQA